MLNKLLQQHELCTEPEICVPADLIHNVIAQMKQCCSDWDEVFLLDVDIATLTDATWPVVAFNVELATFMSEVVSRSSSILLSEEWDFILCCLVAWFQSVQPASLSLLRSPCVMALTTATSRLLHSAALCVDNVVPHQRDIYPATLVTEWNDVFSVSAFDVALSLFVSLASDARHSTALLVTALMCSTLYFACPVRAPGL